MTIGLGAFSIGGGPFGGPYPAQEEEALPTLSSSRLIDGISHAYSITDDGDFDAMDGTAQRVMLLLAYARKTSPIITAQSNQDQASLIRAALKPLLEGREPAIDTLRIVVTDDKARTLKYVTYRNRETNTKQTVTPTTVPPQ